MRLIDAEPIEQWLFKRADKSLGNNPYEKVRICAFRTAFELVSHAPTVIVPPPNEPLTLEELRELAGEPVWLVVRGAGRYAIFVGFSFDGIVQFHCATLAESAYGTVWTAYRRKPEEPRSEPAPPAWREHLRRRFDRME